MPTMSKGLYCLLGRGEMKGEMKSAVIMGASSLSKQTG